MEGNCKKEYQLPPQIPQSHPWLVFHHGNEWQRQTFLSISRDRHFTKIIPEFHDKKILCFSKRMFDDGR